VPPQLAPRLGPDRVVAVGLETNVNEAAKLRLGESESGSGEELFKGAVGRSPAAAALQQTPTVFAEMKLFDVLTGQ
jgi:hypothetical protein